ncbi:unnamed protein product, partial [Urochloa humidicola]
RGLRRGHSTRRPRRRGTEYRSCRSRSGRGSSRGCSTAPTPSARRSPRHTHLQFRRRPVNQLLLEPNSKQSKAGGRVFCLQEVLAPTWPRKAQSSIICISLPPVVQKLHHPHLLLLHRRRPCLLLLRRLLHRRRLRLLLLRRPRCRPPPSPPTPTPPMPPPPLPSAPVSSYSDTSDATAPAAVRPRLLLLRRRCLHVLLILDESASFRHSLL